jgi:hypothetical protein
VQGPLPPDDRGKCRRNRQNFFERGAGKDNGGDESGEKETGERNGPNPSDEQTGLEPIFAVLMRISDKGGTLLGAFEPPLVYDVYHRQFRPKWHTISYTKTLEILSDFGGRQETPETPETLF